MYRVQMKNSAYVGCVHLLDFHLEAQFSRYISFLNICRYLILCALHLARPLSECVIGMGKIGSYHYLCFANSYKIVKLCEGSAQNDGPDSFVCSLVIMSVDTTHSL